MVKNRFRLDFWNIVKLTVILLFVVFLVYPFSSLIYRSFFAAKVDGVTLKHYITFFSKKYYYTTLFNSLEVSFITMITSVVLGVPLAYIMTRFNVIGKKLIHILIILSLMSPPFIGAYSWIMLFGRSGFVTKLLEPLGMVVPTIYGKAGIMIVLTLKLFPYVYLYVSGALSSIDSSLEEAAENLGSSKLRRLLTITFPVILPSIAAGAVIVFMTALADFGTPMLLGEGFKVLPVLVYEEYMSEMGGNANLASALSVIVVICSTAVLILQKYLVSKRNYVMTSMRPPKEEQLTGFKRAAASFVPWLIALLSTLPQVVVIITSFVKTNGPIFTKGFSMQSYTSIINRLSQNITNTFVYSFLAIIFIVLLGMLISYIAVRRAGRVGQILDAMIMFPYVIPGAVLGICLLVAFNKKPLLLAGGAFIMVLSYIIKKLPFTVRSASAFLHQMDPSVEEASINLGVSPMKTFFQITARLMMPGVISGAILSWISCINELSTSIMLYTGRTSTISIAIYTEVVRNSFGTAAALATILTVATMVSLGIFMIISKGKVSVV